MTSTSDTSAEIMFNDTSTNNTAATAVDLTPSESQRLAAFILEGWCLLIVGFFGLIGNISAIYVFGRQRVQRNFHALMVTLATFDLCYIGVSAFIFSIPQFAPGFNSTKAYTHALPFILPMAQIGLTGSIYLTCAVTLERYFTVCHPFYRYNHQWPSWLYVGPIVLFAFAYNLPKFFELSAVVNEVETYRLAFLSLINVTMSDMDATESYHLVRTYMGQPGKRDMLASLNLSDPSPTPQPEILYRLAIQDILGRPVHVDNFTEDAAFSEARIVYVNVPTQLRLNQVYVEVFCGWINFIVHTLLPYIGLITLNLLILRRLNAFAMHPGPGHHHNNNSNSITGGAIGGSNRRSSRIGEGGGEGAKKKDVLLAKISLVIVFVFIVCHSVRWVPNVFELYLLHKKSGEQILKWPDWVEITSNLSHVLTVVNSSVNFYIYLVKHPNILVCYRRWKRSHGGDVYTTTASMATTHAHNNGGGGNNGTMAMYDMRKTSNDENKEEIKEEETALLDHKNNGCNNANSKVRFSGSKV